MSILVTEAIVLHAFDYQESSRIYRLATREAGVQSTLARGARNSKVRFGSALGLFAGGIAHITQKASSDLQTLNAFDISSTRSALSADYGRFLGASMIGEMVLRFSSTEPSAELFDVLANSLDRMSESEPNRARTSALEAAWRIIAALGFAPSFSVCASCHDPLPQEGEAPFSHRAGGVLCSRCAGRLPAAGNTAVASGNVHGVRKLPSSVRGELTALVEHGAEFAALVEGAELRAHARLLREFVAEHLGDERPLQAFRMWEEQTV